MVITSQQNLSLLDLTDISQLAVGFSPMLLPLRSPDKVEWFQAKE
jgi:hypothetical protein